MFDEAFTICNSTVDIVQGSVFGDIQCADLFQYKEQFEANIAKIPNEILETGITPLYSNLPECNSSNSTTMKDESALINLDCYAWLSVSPFATNSIDSIGLDIMKGIGFSGRITILDKFEAVGEGKVSSEAILQNDSTTLLKSDYVYNASLDRCFWNTKSKFLFVGIYKDKPFG